MTDRDAILRNILEEPANDNHRLFAAWCEDDGGDPARAEFIRVQVELARVPYCSSCHTGEGTLTDYDCGHDEYRDTLRRRERELLTQFGNGWVPKPLRHAANEWLGTTYKMKRWDGISVQEILHLPESTFARGFISSVRCSWSDWLRHHAAIYWHSEQTAECTTCEGRGKDAYVIGAFGPFPNGCPHCSGGRIPRSFVATAQPLELVRLTTWPDPIALNDTRPADTIYTIDRTFDRVKCPMCGGDGRIEDEGKWHPHIGRLFKLCPTCHGTPLNRWTCDKWKGLEFTMPDATSDYHTHARMGIRDIAAGLGVPRRIVFGETT